MKDYSGIPGTYMFDGEHSRKGYQLNMFCMSLNDPANRERFSRDEFAYLDERGLTPEQKQAVLDRDYPATQPLGIVRAARCANCAGFADGRPRILNAIRPVMAESGHSK